jgi:ferritin-like metal-binding protein YciE
MTGVSLVLAVVITITLYRLLKITKKLQSALKVLADEQSNLVDQFSSVIEKTSADIQRYEMVVKSTQVVQKNLENTSNIVKNSLQEPTIKAKAAKSGISAGLKTFKERRK